MLKYHTDSCTYTQVIVCEHIYCLWTSRNACFWILIDFSLQNNNEIPHSSKDFWALICTVCMLVTLDAFWPTEILTTLIWNLFIYIKTTSNSNSHYDEVIGFHVFKKLFPIIYTDISNQLSQYVYNHKLQDFNCCYLHFQLHHLWNVVRYY